MDLRTFLTFFDVRKGPNGSGEYMCRCPAHDDRQASLCVREGDKGLVLKCQAGCSTSDVLQAAGLSMRDLFRNPSPAVDKPVDKAANKPAPKSRQERPKSPSSASAAPQPERKIDRIYAYTDEKGQTLFEVVRYIPKDFRQRVPDTSARGGYRWSIKGVRSVIYRLPVVLDAIAKGQPVFVVEGEKDADTLGALGYAATTSPMGAGKWREEHSAFLKDADVYILPDNDEPGRQHAKQVAAQLIGLAKSVRILELQSACPQLPEKGDVSDMLGLMGKEKCVAALVELMQRTPVSELSDDLAYNRAAAQYASISGYFVVDGCIAKHTNDGARKMTTFVALPTKIVAKDDGSSVEKVFVIDGWTRSGHPLPQATVRAEDFPSMNWVLKQWDFAANIMPGNNVKDNLRYVMTEVGEKTATRETVYTHTGWRKIGGKYVYLHTGGAIGGERVHVELDSGLSHYGFSHQLGDECTAMMAAAMIPMFQYSMAHRVSVPLLGLCFLTPLREFLSQAGYSPRFAMWLNGKTGSHKSTATALALSFFGDFDIDRFPASFHDTANHIRKKAFLVKDCLLAVDDYHPNTSPQEKRRMEAVAQSLARAYGDGADRGRMKADLTLQESMPPRGMALMSGEQVPDIGESGVARFFMIEVNPATATSPGDIPICDELEVAQHLAKRGYFRKAMHDYILWLSRHAEDLPDTLGKAYVRLRSRALKEGAGVHGRAAEAVAHVLLGYEMMLQYMVTVGAMTSDQAQKEMQEAWALVLDNSRAQADIAKEDRPVSMFVRALSELITTKAVGIRDISGVNAADPANLIGYADAQYYYLMPDLAYAKVCRLYQDQGVTFSLSKRALYKQMVGEALIEVDSEGKSAKGKRIGDKLLRLLWIRRSTLDGTTAQEQVRMDMVPVEDPDDPF